jgi:hypothetical protein
MEMRDALARKSMADLTRAGWSAVEIGLLLGVHPRTVKRHRYQIRKRVDPQRLGFRPFLPIETPTQGKS